ncbi:hypothetical protein Agub_g1237, partial [Astrephomene gubernaculifera]
LAGILLSYHGLPPMSFMELAILVVVLREMQDNILSTTTSGPLLDVFPGSCFSLVTACNLVRCAREMLGAADPPALPCGSHHLAQAARPEQGKAGPEAGLEPNPAQSRRHAADAASAECGLGGAGEGRGTGASSGRGGGSGAPGNDTE